MAKSTYQHDRDGLAIDALRRVFPSTWLYKNPVNMFGNREYSEDLIIEIINDDARKTTTGVEFGVQNKTDVKVRKRYVTVDLEVSDVKRLMGLQRPVLIHAFDIPSGTSYWTWLHDWYAANGTSFRRRKRVAIKIPKKNVLNARNLQRIEATARWEHTRHNAFDVAEMARQRYAKDYDITVGSTNTGIVTIVNPKHPGAVPVIQALDEVSGSAIMQVIETGRPVQLAGQFTLQNFPELILESLVQPLENVWLAPPIGGQSSKPVRIEFLDQAENVVIKSSHVMLNCIEPGTVEKRWKGSDTTQNIAYDIQENLRTNTTKYQVSFNNPSVNAVEMYRFLAIQEKLHSVKKLRRVDLETESTSDIEWLFYPGEELDIEEIAQLRMAKALATIEQSVNVTFPLPWHITRETILLAEWIANAIETGIGKVKGEKVIPDGYGLYCSDPVERARQTFSNLKPQDKVLVHAAHTVTDVSYDLLSQKVELGSVHYVFGNATVSNWEEVQQRLASIHDEDADIITVFNVDVDEVYVWFDRWNSAEDGTLAS